MINEEDHLRIQALYPGLQLREALTQANHIDNYIESQLEYAFDETHRLFNKLSYKCGNRV